MTRMMCHICGTEMAVVKRESKKEGERVTYQCPECSKKCVLFVAKKMTKLFVEG